MGFSGDGFVVDIFCNKSDVKSVPNVNKIIVVNEYYDHNQPETMENFYNKVKILLEQENYDHVISENITPPIDITFLQGHSLVNRLKKTKNPVEAFFYNFRKIKKQRIKYQEKWIKQGYRKIFTVSEVLKRDIVDNFGVSEDKISVIYPGTDTCEPQNPYTERETITFGILAPGFKIKGGFIFLKALNLIRKKQYKFMAKIVYPGFSKNIGTKFLAWNYNLKDCTEFLSYQEDIKAFYDSIDCLVVPSIEDTFNLAALEAMACGKPVIISNNAGACELIKDRDNGFVFDIKKNGAKNLAEKMMFFLDNPELYSKLSSLARETAKIYSWEKTFKEFRDALLKL